jgi:hypothetical protein
VRVVAATTVRDGKLDDMSLSVLMALGVVKFPGLVREMNLLKL